MTYLTKKSITKFVISHQGRLIDAMEAINNNKCRTVFVEQNSRLIGSISEGDILRCLLNYIDLHANVKPFMKESFIHISKLNWKQIVMLFGKHNINALPFVNDEMKLKDVILIQDVLNYLNEKDELIK